MAGIDRSTQRVIAVIALVIVAALALRGYIPGGEPAQRDRPASNPVATVVVIAMLSAAVAIVGFAIIARMRDRRPRPTSAGELPRGSGTIGRPTWRFSLIALGLIISWLLLVTLLTRVGGSGPPQQPASVPPAASESAAPAPDGRPPPRPPSTEPDADTNVVRYLIPPMLVLMVLVVVGTTVASRRQRRGAHQYVIVDDIDDMTVAPAAAESLARAAEVGLAEIGDLRREPREAIIACYAAMEHELMRVPGAVPQDCDTPSEVLARAVANHAVRADSATQLVELFEEARFSPHVMTEAHRDAAMQVLEQVHAELPKDVARGVA